MRHILKPLVPAGKTGLEMTSGDGAVYNVFPILAIYAADYPEQCMLSCAKYGTCPVCDRKATELGVPGIGNYRTSRQTLATIEKALTVKSRKTFATLCKEAKAPLNGMTARPFWEDLPYVDIHSCIAPDILHQCFQGVFKHLVKWCSKIIGETRLDQRLQRLPPAYGVRHFDAGWSQLSQVTGPERKDMAKVLLGVLVGSGASDRAIKAVTAILDFIYTAQYLSHNTDSLVELEHYLSEWHTHKDALKDADIGRADFNIPKFHMLGHYTRPIRLFGSTDNYNTEFFERIHIDIIKTAWDSSNHRDAMPQMLECEVRKEKIELFESFIAWKSGVRVIRARKRRGQCLRATSGMEILMAKHTPSTLRVSNIMKLHHAPFFSYYLHQFILDFCSASSKQRLRLDSSMVNELKAERVHVWHQVNLIHPDIQELDEEAETKDRIVSCPASGNRKFLHRPQ
jgi:hypothetical protein